MKKTVSIAVALVLVLGAVWLGSSWWFSRQVESRYRQLVARAAHLSGAEIAVESYQRGWRNATARIRVVVPAPPASHGHKLPALSFTVINDIVSGPFPGGAAGWRPAMALVHSRVALGSNLLKELRKELPAFPEVLPVQSTAVIYLGGNGESWTNAVPVHKTLAKPEPVTIDWQGLKGHSTFTTDFKECKGELQMPSLEVNAKTGRLKLAGCGATYDLHLPQGLEGLMLGDFAYKLKSLEFASESAKGGRKTTFTLQNLAVKGSNWETEGVVDGVLRTSFERLNINGVDNGPGVWDMQVTNLDAAALREMQQLSRHLRADRRLSPQQRQAQFMAGLGKLWPRFAARSPGVEIRDLSFKGSDGHLHCRGKIAIDGSNKAFLASPLLLPKVVTAQASIDISARMLRKIVGVMVSQRLVTARSASGQPPLPEEQLNAMVDATAAQVVASLTKKHVLIRQGDVYTLSFDYDSGKAKLNGQSIPLN
ncbi:MAG TPA: YdgA family protein [Desulfuromonadales bacterium]|nr:YdgA family protein [Desulfuromonadales bacterium]